MTRAFVADASVAVGWVHPAQATRQTTAMLDTIAEGATLEVSALWPLEVTNALLVINVLAFIAGLLMADYGESATQVNADGLRWVASV